MPQRDRRRSIAQNTSTIYVLLSLSCVLASMSAEYRYDTAVQSPSPSSARNIRDATVPTNFMIIERQLPSNVISLLLPLPTPIPIPSPLPNGTPIPLLISPYIPSSSAPSVSLSRSASSSPFVTSTTSASTQPSQSGNTTATNNANVPSRLTAITFLPFIILTSFFVISLMGWCLHGWCTRRPKENFVAMGIKESRKKRGGWFWNRKAGWGEENDELVCGPAYVSFVDQDVEEFATVRQSGRYKWPPMSVTDQGPHRVSQTKHDDEGPYPSEAIPFEFPTTQTVRSVPSAQPPREPKVGKRSYSPTTTTGPMSPTSIALRDLYEVVLRNEYDGPGPGKPDEQAPLHAVGSGVMATNRSTSGRRKGHVRRGSESHDEATQLLDLGGRWRGVILSDDDSDPVPGTKLEVRNPSVGEGRLGLREGTVGLVSDGILDEEDYTPLPTPTRIQFSLADPPSLRSRKARAKAVQRSQNPLSHSKDILPAHPKQLMSPPLENQMYFVPMPTTADQNVFVSDSRHDEPVVGLHARVRGSVRPKSTVSNPRENLGEQRNEQSPSEVVDDHPGYRVIATTSPLTTAPREAKNKPRDNNNSSRRDGARKGKGKLVKASPASKFHAKRQADEQD